MWYIHIISYIKYIRDSTTWLRNMAPKAPAQAAEPLAVLRNWKAVAKLKHSCATERRLRASPYPPAITKSCKSFDKTNGTYTYRYLSINMYIIYMYIIAFYIIYIILHYMHRYIYIYRYLKKHNIISYYIITID